MCGIAGIFGDAPLGEDALRERRWAACLGVLSRRGPDARGRWRSPSGHAELGHTRLSIVDPSERGSQPMTAREGRAAISYNGELYNAPELRRELEAAGHAFGSASDTEVLLRGWLEWGEDVLRRAHGMYAFAAWDDEARTLLAAVDHAGMKPLCWTRAGGRLAVASDADALRALTGGGGEPDACGLRLLLTLGCCPAPHTLWAGVRKLEPGTLLRWRPGGDPVIERHWDAPRSLAGRPASREAFDELLGVVARQHMLADVPVGAFLSGGLDSAAVVAAAAGAGVRPACFTLSMDGEADESVDAAGVASALGLPHSVAPAGDDLAGDLAWYAEAFDEPQGFSALLTATRISALARERVKAVIGGDGGDEAFGGYLWQRETGPGAWPGLADDASLRADAQPLAAAVRDPQAGDAARARARLAFGAASFVHAYASRVFPGFHPAEAHELTRALGEAFDGDDAVRWLARADEPSLPHLRRVQRLDTMGFCPASILPKVDRAAMGVGLEVRAPLLDRRLLELGLAQPVEAGESDPSGAGSRPLLRGFARARLGDALSRRGKQGFSLRIAGEHRRWEALAAGVDAGPLVRGGILRTDWRRYIPRGDTPRLRLIVMLSAWAERRL